MQEASIALIKSFRQWKPDGGASLLTWIHNPVKYALIKCAKAHKKKLIESTSLDAPFENGVINYTRKGYTRGGGRAGRDRDTTCMYDLIGEDFKYPEDLEEKMQKEIKKLPARERKILELTLDGKLLEEIGAVVGISSERVRQVRDAALELLKHRLSKPRHL